MSKRKRITSVKKVGSSNIAKNYRYNNSLYQVNRFVAFGVSSHIVLFLNN